MGLINCKDCVFWYPHGKQTQDRELSAWGNCHRHAPSPLMAGVDDHSVRPKTDPAWGCGEGELITSTKPTVESAPNEITEEEAEHYNTIMESYRQKAQITEDEASAFARIASKVMEHPKYKDNPDIQWLGWMVGAIEIYAKVTNSKT